MIHRIGQCRSRSAEYTGSEPLSEGVHSHCWSSRLQFSLPPCTPQLVTKTATTAVVAAILSITLCPTLCQKGPYPHCARSPSLPANTVAYSFTSTPPAAPNTSHNNHSPHTHPKATDLPAQHPPPAAHQCWPALLPTAHAAGSPPPTAGGGGGQRRGRRHRRGLGKAETEAARGGGGGQRWRRHQRRGRRQATREAARGGGGASAGNRGPGRGQRQRRRRRQQRGWRQAAVETAGGEGGGWRRGRRR